MLDATPGLPANSLLPPTLLRGVTGPRLLDRREVRRRFDRRFSATAMARGYLDVYADRLAKAPFAADLIGDDAEIEEASSALTSLAQIA